MARAPYERYQEKPFLGSSHTWAFKHLNNLPQDAAVLDVGPGSGIIGKFLWDKGLRKLSGVEIDAETRVALSGLYETLVPSFELLPKEECYDCVVLLDVLEHMADPFGALTELTSRLKPGAVLLISVPNITHLAIRIMMLFGYFEYMERGPLDRTHLQFFSRRRFKKLITEVIPENVVIETSGTIEPLELFLPEWLIHHPLYRTLSHLRMMLMRLWPSLLAYQHVGIVKYNGVKFPR